MPALDDNTQPVAEQLRGVLDASPAGVLCCRAVRDDTGTIIDFEFELANAAAEQTCGRPESDLIGRTMMELFPGNKPDGLFDKYAAVVDTGEPLMVIHHYSHEHIDTSFDIRATPMEGDRLSLTFLDVTEAERSRRQLEETRQKLELFVQHTPAAVAMFDRDMRYLLHSRRWLEDYGLTEDVIGRCHYDVFPDILDRWKDDHRRVLAGEVLTCEEDPFDRDDGSRVWIRWALHPWREDSGSIGGLLMFTEVITERKEAELALAQVTDRLAMAQDASGAGYWTWDMRDNSVYYSDRWYQMLGYEPGELPMEFATFEELVHEEDLPEYMRHLTDHVEGRSHHLRREIRMRTKSGGWRWIQTTGRIDRRDADAAPTHMSGFHFDIDAMKESQRELAEAKATADAANQSKSEFLANMSHEIRTPMTAILGFADLLCDPEIERGERIEHATTIRRNGRHLLELINDILDISKIEAGRLDVERIGCSPVLALEEVFDLLGSRAEAKGVDLNVRYETDLPAEVGSDPTRLRQILVNVIGNALKFTEHGSVVVSVALRDKDGKGMLTYEIADTGIGMDPQHAANLFEPFNQGDNSVTRRFGGTGLGLAISRRLARALGGDVNIVSTEQGAGSVFRVTIDPGPLDGVELVSSQSATRQTEAATSPEPTTGTSLSGARVLLAEDGPDNQKLLSFHLAKAGADVTIAANGLETIDCVTRARDEGRPFGLVIMDMQMPELDGYAATGCLRAAGFTMPIVALTAHAMEGDRDKCIAAGCNDYATKPIQRDELLAISAAWLAAGPRRRAG